MQRKTSILFLILFHLAGLYCIGNPAGKTDFKKASLYTNELSPSDSFYFELAFHYAPIHYQDVDDSKPKSDYISSINYDGDWRSDNNWNNVNKFPLSAHVYYSVVETSTHWFITYAFFHPQDWDDDFEQEHENDMEGLLSVVRKTTGLGKLEAIITVAHTDFYSYTIANNDYKNGSQNIDGTITLKKDLAGLLRPVTCQEAKGHGLKAFPYAGDFTGKTGEDGIIYYPSRTKAGIPTSSYDRNVPYKLVSLTTSGGLWSKQLLEASKSSTQSLTFNKWGNLKGNSDGGCGDGVTLTCADNSANAPWNWDDSDDGDVHSGMLALDPAATVKKYFTVPGGFSITYTNNIYLTQLKSKGYSSQNKPIGWPSALNLSTLFTKLQ